MVNRDTKFVALRGLALASVMGLCSVGVSQGALTLNVYDGTGGLHVEFDGGTLDFNGQAPIISTVNVSFVNMVFNGSREGTYYIGTGGTNNQFSWNSLAYSTNDLNGYLEGNNSLTFADNSTIITFGRGLLTDGGGGSSIWSLSTSSNEAWIDSGSTFDLHLVAAGHSVASAGLVEGSSRVMTLASGDTFTIEIGEPVSIPEPSGLVLAMSGIGLLTIRRNRQRAI